MSSPSSLTAHGLASYFTEKIEWARKEFPHSWSSAPTYSVIQTVSVDELSCNYLKSNSQLVSYSSASPPPVFPLSLILLISPLYWICPLHYGITFPSLTLQCPPPPTLLTPFLCQLLFHFFVPLCCRILQMVSNSFPIIPSTYSNQAFVHPQTPHGKALVKITNKLQIA